MERKIYTIEDYHQLQDTPVEPFKKDLRNLCRAAFGLNWTDKHPGQEAIDKLRSYDFLPEVFIAMYEIIGGEERIHQQGLLSVEEIELDEQPWGEQTAKYLVFLRKGKQEYSFSRVQRFTGNQHLDHPFCGLYQLNVGDSTYRKRKFWDKWCFWGGQSQFQTLPTALLRLVGETLIQELPNCVWSQVPVKKEGKLSRYESLARRLGVQTMETVYPISWEYLCDPGRGVLVRYFDDGRKKVLIYSQNPAALEALGESWPIEWQRRDGKRILDPAKFIQSPAPVTFSEKLEVMSRALLGKRSLALTPEEIDKVEECLGIKFPDALREFYLHFGKGGKLFSSDSLHNILTFSQMNSEDDDFGEEFQIARDKESILLAVENQGVWRIYLNCKTGEPWMDWGQGPQDCWGLDMEGTLLYLLAMNSLGFLPRGGNCDMEDTSENRELLGHYFHFLVEGKMSVFADPDKGLVGCRAGKTLYIKAHNEKALKQLEENADIFVGEF